MLFLLENILDIFLNYACNKRYGKLACYDIAFFIYPTVTCEIQLGNLDSVIYVPETRISNYDNVT